MEKGKGSRLIYSLNWKEICYPTIEFQRLFGVNLRCIVPFEFAGVGE